VIFVDANVPMHAAGRPHPLRIPCQRALEAVVLGRVSIASDVEVVQEILHRYTASGQRGRAIALARAFTDLLDELYPVGRADIELAMELHARPELPARDSLHWAVMQRNGIDTILTADRHFEALPGITRVDPPEWERLL
jgi:hypothetical protein